MPRALDVVRRLGIPDATMEDFREGFDVTIVHDGLKYEFWTGTTGGKLLVSADTE